MYQMFPPPEQLLHVRECVPLSLHILKFVATCLSSSGTRGVSTSSSASDKDRHTVLGLKIYWNTLPSISCIIFPSLASIGSGCSSTHEQDALGNVTTVISL